MYALSALSIPEAISNEPIDVGQFAAPQLIDLDGDAVLEMVVGEKNGVLTLFEQNSLGAWEQYTSPVHGDSLWGIVVDNVLGINGHSIPSFTLVDNDIRVLVTNEIGTVQDFGVVPASWDATLDEVNSDLLGGALGFYAAAAFKDLNDDDLLDVVMGVQNGGLLALSGVVDSSNTALADPIRELMAWKVMPNPGRSELHWETNLEWSGSLEIHDMMGKRIDVIPVNHQRRGVVDAQEWPAGSYILRPMAAHTAGNKKGAPVRTPLTWIKLPD